MRTSSNNSKLFLKEFLKNRKLIGSITPSSKSLARKMLRNVDFDNAQVIVELGAGTGAITREILTRLQPQTQFFCLDSNPNFILELQKLKVNTNVNFVLADAKDIESLLTEKGDIKVDSFISSLPLSLMDNTHKTALMEGIKNRLKVSGSYIQYQYTPEGYRFIKKFWKEVKLSFVFANFPPSIIYKCQLE